MPFWPIGTATAGFGFGLEPDTACPDSQPLFTQMAFSHLDEVGLLTRDLIDATMPYLLFVARPGGGLPWMLRPSGSYPRAVHFDEVDEKPALHPTAPILGLLLKNGYDHPWMAEAEAFCWSALAASEETACAACILLRLLFLEQRRDDPRATVEIDRIKGRVSRPGVVSHDFTDPDLGVYGHPTPLSYAPRPDSPLRPIFSDEDVNRHLDALIGRQQADGRWRNPWGISEGTRLEWDGMETLDALLVLKANGRLAGF